MNLYLVAILMMLVTLAAMSFLFYLRFGHVPMQDAWTRWSKSGAVISNELQQIGGVVPGSALPGKTATVDAGIRRCTIKGKVIFSDVECADDNPTTRAVKLYDSKGGVPPKAPEVAKEPEPDLQSKMIERAIK